jgi:hypothetical protein
MILVFGVAAGVSQLLPNPFLKGSVVGAAIVEGPMAIWMLTIQLTGTASIMMGDQAEQWTAQELRRVTRRGWRLINHFGLRTDDIDHVLIGPPGAFVFETKWSASDWLTAFNRRREKEAVEQVLANARSMRLWHPVKSRQVPVTPVVVLWGKGLSKWPEDHRIRVVDGAFVITGRALRGWLEGQDAQLVEASTIDEVWQAMDEQVTRRDPIDAERHPLPTSLAEWARLVGLAAVSAVLGVWVLVLLLNHATEWWVALAVHLVLALLVLALGRLVDDSRAVVWSVRAWVTTSLALWLVLAASAVLYTV